MADILKSIREIDEILDVMIGSMHTGSESERREGRPSDCFVYVLSGITDYFFKGTVLRVFPGSVIYLPRGSIYKMHVIEEYHHIYIDFQFVECGHEPTVLHEMHAMEGVFRKSLRQWLKGSDSSMLCCLGGLYEIYGKMMERRRTGYISEGARALALEAENRMVQRLTDHTLKMTEIADSVGISTAHLRRIFHATFGIAPNTYLQQKRIQDAKRLLIETEFSLEQIADMTGFCNAYYFGRVFKALNGMPPGAYRHENGR